VQDVHGFRIGFAQNHAAEVGLPIIAKLVRAIKRKAEENLFRPYSAVVDESL
jgi:hypothetical protein